MSGPYLKLSDGSHYNLAHPRHAPSVEVIAHMLARIYRWRGATKRGYSVALHSIAVAERVWQETNNAELALKALFHDAAEIVTGDIPSPVKELIGVNPVLEEIEGVFMELLWRKLKVARPDPWEKARIKDADQLMLIVERDELTVPGKIDHYDFWPEVSSNEWPQKLLTLSEQDAEDLFKHKVRDFRRLIGHEYDGVNAIMDMAEGPA